METEISYRYEKSNFLKDENLTEIDWKKTAIFFTTNFTYMIFKPDVHIIYYYTLQNINIFRVIDLTINLEGS